MIRLHRLLNWAASLSAPSKATADLPTCPYARRAFDEGRVSIIFKTRFDGIGDIRRIVESWSGQHDVVLLVVERTAIAPGAARFLAGEINAGAAAADLVVMVDHPDQPFVVAGHSNSQGDYLIFFIQRLSTLLAAETSLKATGYYDNWPDRKD